MGDGREIGKPNTSRAGMEKTSGGDGNGAAMGSGGCLTGDMGDGLRFGKLNTSMARMEQCKRSARKVRCNRGLQISPVMQNSYCEKLATYVVTTSVMVSHSLLAL